MEPVSDRSDDGRIRRRGSETAGDGFIETAATVAAVVVLVGFSALLSVLPLQITVYSAKQVVGDHRPPTPAVEHFSYTNLGCWDERTAFHFA